MSNKENILGNIPVFGPGRRNTGSMKVKGGKKEFVKGGGKDARGKKGKGKAPIKPAPPKAPKAPKKP